MHGNYIRPEDTGRQASTRLTDWEDEYLEPHITILSLITILAIAIISRLVLDWCGRVISGHLEPTADRLEHVYTPPSPKEKEGDFYGIRC